MLDWDALAIAERIEYMMDHCVEMQIAYNEHLEKDMKPDEYFAFFTGDSHPSESDKQLMRASNEIWVVGIALRGTLQGRLSHVGFGHDFFHALDNANQAMRVTIGEVI